MQNSHTPIILDRIPQSAIQSATMSNIPDLRLNAMINDYSFRIGTLEKQVSTIDNSVEVIKSNYLTTSKFYFLCVLGLASIFGAGATAYFNLDNKFETRFAKIDERFEKVESNIHSLDVRLTKVESHLDNVELRLTNVEKKLDTIDDKLDILIQQKQAKNKGLT